MTRNKNLENTTRMSTSNEDIERLGMVLAIGASLIGEGKIPDDVLHEKTGHYAICLIRSETEHEVRTIAPGQSIEVGREEDEPALWSIPDPWLSRHHFRLSVDTERGILRIEDLGSSNGTLVKGTPVPAGGRMLIRGDVVFAGRNAWVVL